PKIKKIIVRGLTPATKGNATGIGMSEFCKTSVVNEIDVNATRINCITGNHLTAAMTPLHYESDAEILDVCMVSSGLATPPEISMMWINNTLEIGEVEVSESYWDEAQSREDLEILTEIRDLPIDDDGQMLNMTDSDWYSGSA
ncbi:MAG TPA: [Fe-S]-binding protein, partial [Planctomycetaceae bacterium]|nr:[Fe-S]-binding protein [Planctomycetaceae bacterium]